MSINNIDVRPIRIDGSDTDIALAARICYGKYYIEDAAVEPLIDKLYKNKHMTPFEFGSMWFLIRCSRACHSQFLQYRTATRLTRGQRYTKPIEIEEKLDVEPFMYDAMTEYMIRLENGERKEDARRMLPMDTLTDFYFRINIRNLLHFFDERLHKTAQKEIRTLAEMMLEETTKYFPYTISVWKKYGGENK